MDSVKTIKVEDNDDDECKENGMFIRGTFCIKEEPNHESLQSDQRHENENLNEFDAMKVEYDYGFLRNKNVESLKTEENENLNELDSLHLQHL